MSSVFLSLYFPLFLYYSSSFFHTQFYSNLLIAPSSNYVFACTSLRNVSLDFFTTNRNLFVLTIFVFDNDYGTIRKKRIERKSRRTEQRFLFSILLFVRNTTIHLPKEKARKRTAKILFRKKANCIKFKVFFINIRKLLCGFIISSGFFTS